MKFKKEPIILIVIIALLVLYLVFKDKDGTHYDLPNLSKISVEKIINIDIQKPDAQLMLTKKDDIWYIDPEKYPADSQKIDKMIDVIKNLNVSALVSESKNYTRYNLGAEKKITIKASDEKTIAREFEIGKTAPTFQHTFIKLKDDPNVYHAPGDFKRHFDQSIENLREKKIFTFDPTDIHECNIIMGKKSIGISKKDNFKKKQGENENSSSDEKQEIIWQTRNKNIFDEAEITTLLSYLSGLKCDKYIIGKTKKDYKEPIYSIAMKGTKEHFIAIYQKKDDKVEDFSAISSDNDYPFFLSNSTVENLKNKIEKIVGSEEKEAR